MLEQDCREVFTGVPCTVSCVIHHSDVDATEEPDLEVMDEKNQRHLMTRMATPISTAKMKKYGIEV